MKPKTLIFVWLFGLALPLSAQKIDYAREMLDVLCKPDFHGRGYVKHGDRKAARYIAHQFRKWDIQHVGNSYFQEFQILVNTFPGAMSARVDNQKLIPGLDFIADGSSPSCSTKVALQWIDSLTFRDTARFSTFFEKDLSEKFLVLDTKGLGWKQKKQITQLVMQENVFGAKGVVEVVEKYPLYVPSRYVRKHPMLKIRRKKLPRTADTLTLHIENEFLSEYTTRNVIGFLPGKTDSFIVFSAHYDHLGRMGEKTFFPGAHDNASGTAMVVDLARHYATQKEKPHYSLAFMLFSGEEIGLLGSKYYTENPLFPLQKIKFLINLDLVGSGDKGITLVNGTIYTKEIELLRKINQQNSYLPQIKARAPAANSDHFFFHKNGVPAVFIYSMGDYKQYHNIFDRSERVPLTRYREMFRLFTTFAEKYR